MKSLTNYILERFVSTDKNNQRYLLYYPYIGDLAWANKNCDKKGYPEATTYNDSSKITFPE